MALAREPGGEEANDELAFHQAPAAPPGSLQTMGGGPQTPPEHAGLVSRSVRLALALSSCLGPAHLPSPDPLCATGGRPRGGVSPAYQPCTHTLQPSATALDRHPPARPDLAQHRLLVSSRPGRLRPRRAPVEQVGRLPPPVAPLEGQRPGLPLARPRSGDRRPPRVVDPRVARRGHARLRRLRPRRALVAERARHPRPPRPLVRHRRRHGQLARLLAPAPRPVLAPRRAANLVILGRVHHPLALRRPHPPTPLLPRRRVQVDPPRPRRARHGPRRRRLTHPPARPRAPRVARAELGRRGVPRPGAAARAPRALAARLGRVARQPEPRRPRGARRARRRRARGRRRAGAGAPGRAREDEHPPPELARQRRRKGQGRRLVVVRRARRYRVARRPGRRPRLFSRRRRRRRHRRARRRRRHGRAHVQRPERLLAHHEGRAAHVAAGGVDRALAPARQAARQARAQADRPVCARAGRGQPVDRCRRSRGASRSLSSVPLLRSSSRR